MTIDRIEELEREIASGRSGWVLGEFMAEDVIDAYYLGGGARCCVKCGKPVGGV